jgi:hypothetical protein
MMTAQMRKMASQQLDVAKASVEACRDGLGQLLPR